MPGSEADDESSDNEGEGSSARKRGRLPKVAPRRSGRKRKRAPTPPDSDDSASTDAERGTPVVAAIVRRRVIADPAPPISNAATRKTRRIEESSDSSASTFVGVSAPFDMGTSTDTSADNYEFRKRERERRAKVEPENPDDERIVSASKPCPTAAGLRAHHVEVVVHRTERAPHVIAPYSQGAEAGMVIPESQDEKSGMPLSPPATSRQIKRESFNPPLEPEDAAADEAVSNSGTNESEKDKGFATAPAGKRTASIDHRNAVTGLANGQECLECRLS